MHKPPIPLLLFISLVAVLLLVAYYRYGVIATLAKLLQDISPPPT